MCHDWDFCLQVHFSVWTPYYREIFLPMINLCQIQICCVYNVYQLTTWYLVKRVDFSFCCSFRSSSQVIRAVEPPRCECGAHFCCSRTRIGMLNDACHNRKYLDALRQVRGVDSVCRPVRLWTSDRSAVQHVDTSWQVCFPCCCTKPLEWTPSNVKIISKSKIP